MNRVTIRSVANGYVVECKGMVLFPEQETWIFSTLDEMLEFLAKGFTNDEEEEE